MAATRKYLGTGKEFRQAVAESLSGRQVLGRVKLMLKCSRVATTKRCKTRVRYKAFGRKATLEEILVENSAYVFTHGLRGRLLKEGLKSHGCERCGLAAWCGQPIPRELHPCNGINNDHRLSNLHLLCPNCHALTNNYRGKNQGGNKA